MTARRIEIEGRVSGACQHRSTRYIKTIEGLITCCWGHLLKGRQSSVRSTRPGASAVVEASCSSCCASCGEGVHPLPPSRHSLKGMASLPLDCTTKKLRDDLCTAATHTLFCFCATVLYLCTEHDQWLLHSSHTHPVLLLHDHAVSAYWMRSMTAAFFVAVMCDSLC